MSADKGISPYRLTWEQWLMLAIMGLALAACLGWGLPDEGTSTLLTLGGGPGPQERRLLSQQRQSFYRHLESRRRRQAQELPARLLRGQKLKLGEQDRQPGLFYDRADKLTALRAYILGSAALDERKTYRALSRMRPAAGDLDPKLYLYGGAYLYPTGALIFALKTLGLVRITSQLAYYLDHPRDMARLYLAGRGLNLAAYLGIMLILALWAGRLGGRAAANLALVAFACSSLPLWQALVSKPHLYAACWGLWGLYLLYRYGQEPRPRRLWGAVVALGLAAGASLPAAVLLLALPVLLYRPGGVKRWLVISLAACLGAGLVFLLTNPYLVTSYREYLLALVEHGAGSGGGYGYAQGSLAKVLGFWGQVGLRDYAFPLVLLGLGGLLWSLARPGEQRRLAGLTLVLALLVSAFIPVPRITIFLGPLFCLFAGVTAARLLPRARAGRALVLVLLLAPGLAVLGLNLDEALHHDAWYQPLRRWLAENPLDASRTVAVYGSLDPTNLPPFPFWPPRLLNLKKLGSHRPLPHYVFLGMRGGPRQWWQARSYRRYYRLVCRAGYRPVWGWLAGLRPPPPVRRALWIYKRK